MLKEKLLNWKWYKDKIPLYLQNSYGYQEHFKIFYDILINLDDYGNKLLQYVDIMNIQKIENKEQSTEILNFFGNLYKLKRTMNVYNYHTKQYQDITLSNDEFLKVLLVKIFQINYDGTRKSFLDFYKKVFDDKLKFYINNQLLYTINVVSSFEQNSNLDLLYNSTNLLFVNIMGIIYNRYIEETTYDLLARFDDITKKFDVIGASRFL